MNAFMTVWRERVKWSLTMQVMQTVSCLCACAGAVTAVASAQPDAKSCFTETSAHWRSLDDAVWCSLALLPSARPPKEQQKDIKNGEHEDGGGAYPTPISLRFLATTAFLTNWVAWLSRMENYATLGMSRFRPMLISCVRAATLWLGLWSGSSPGPLAHVAAPPSSHPFLETLSTTHPLPPPQPPASAIPIPLPRPRRDIKLNFSLIPCTLHFHHPAHRRALLNSIFWLVWTGASL